MDENEKYVNFTPSTEISDVQNYRKWRIWLMLCDVVR